MKPHTPKPKPDGCRITHVNNAGAPWTVSFPTVRSGMVRRSRKSFANEKRARKFAAEMDAEIAERGICFGSLPAEVRRAYLYFLEESPALAAKGMNVPDFGSLVRNGIDALRHEVAEQKFTVAEAIEQFLTHKAPHQAAKTFRSLQLRLRLFATSFGDRPIQSISASEVRTWLTELPRQRNPKEGSQAHSRLSALSLNHYRSALCGLYHHAERENWIAKNPITAVPPEKVARLDATVPSVINPADVVRIMTTALNDRPEIVPALALSMFAGLRLGEAASIDLSILSTQVVLESGHFILPLGRSKTNNRYIPIVVALRGWLDAQPRQIGNAWEGTQKDLKEKIREVLTISGAEPVSSSPRYTYIRHRLAQTRDVLGIMHECGIRFGLVQTLSRIPVSSDDAETFFSIMPSTTI